MGSFSPPFYTANAFFMPPSASHVRAVYRGLLRAAARLPGADGPALRAEARSRFRAGATAQPEDATSLMNEAEARLHDASFFGIPHPRLEHGSQHSARALQEAKSLGGGGAPSGDPAEAAAAAAAGSADPGVRTALAAAAARARAKQGK